MQILPERATATPQPHYENFKNIFANIYPANQYPTDGHLYYNDRVAESEMLIEFTTDASASFKVKTIRLVCSNFSGCEGVESLTIIGKLSNGQDVNLLSNYPIGVDYSTELDVTVPINSNDPVVSITAKMTYLLGNDGGGSNIMSFIIDAVPVGNVTYVAGNNAYHGQVLSMNTTEKILAKRNDKRVGLLGLANDGANFGDLYVVGPDGKAHLTKTATKSEVIFEGRANGVGDYIFQTPIDIFKEIMVCFSCDNNTTKANTLKGTHIIPLIDINFGTTLQHVRAHRIVILENGHIDFGFKDSKTLRIDRFTTTSYNTSVQITKVIGLY